MNNASIIDIQSPHDSARLGEAGKIIRSNSNRVVAAVIRQFLSRSKCADIVSVVYHNKQAWTPGYLSQQFGFGEVYYHHHDAGTTTDYFGRAGRSNQLYATLLPDLYPLILEKIAALLGSKEAHIRPRWAGPGIVIFPAGEYVSTSGGVAHVDWEGVTPDQLDDENVCPLSFVAMLSKPDAGGGLRIWPGRYDKSQNPSNMTLDAANSILIDYQLGDLVCFRALWPHQIQSFSGDTDRICLTFHALDHSGNCEVWF